MAADRSAAEHERSWRSGGLAALVVAVMGLSACGGSPSPLATGPANTSSGSNGGGLMQAGEQSTDAGIAIDPAYFSAGACVAFPPTIGNWHLTVFLDAGHGGLDPGAVGTTESGGQRVIAGGLAHAIEQYLS